MAYIANGWTSWPLLDDHHRDLLVEFDRWAETHVTTHTDPSGEPGSEARALYRDLACDGWFSRATQEAGSGRGSLTEACLIRERLAFSSGLADVSFSEPWLASLALTNGGKAAEDFLDRHLSGSCLLAFALSEPDAGSDASALHTTARSEGTGFTISGHKTWTSNAGLADAYIVFARTGDAPTAAAISAFVVDANSPGIHLEERLEVLPPHTVGTLRFDEVRVPADHLLGDVGTGFATALRCLETFRVSVAAACVGFARRALHEALHRSRTRETFGKPISRHQLIQGKLADMAVAVDAAALLTLRAAWEHDHTDQPMNHAASTAKLFATESAQRVIDDAVQIFGGLGVTRGVVVERLYREIRAFRIFDGSSEIQRLIIAKAALTDRSGPEPAPHIL